MAQKLAQVAGFRNMGRASTPFRFLKAAETPPQGWPVGSRQARQPQIKGRVGVVLEARALCIIGRILRNVLFHSDIRYGTLGFLRPYTEVSL
jgi:hypothetical protein